MPIAPVNQRQFPCSQCGAELTFDPASSTLVCQHCGHHTPIPVSDSPIQELDYQSYVNGLSDQEPVHEKLVVRCTACGALTHLGPDVTADRCLFCGSPIVAQTESRRLIKPRALLPFLVARNQAQGAFAKWLGALWFAPGDLRKKAEDGNLYGVYVPCWTFNTDVTTRYSGQRGQDYITTETYTEFINGRPVTRTRQVTRIRWYSCDGKVNNDFRNLIVLACTSLPPRQAAHLQPWDLNHLVAYADEFLCGFAAESYQIDLRQGFDLAKAQTVAVIRGAIEQDIGGDHQRILSMDSDYLDVTFKHILVPLWISAYFYGGKSYRFLVNARSGRVQGERPYSVWKISVLVAAILAVIIGLVIFQQNRSHQVQRPYYGPQQSEPLER